MDRIKQTNYNYRFLAQIVFTAETPLAVGSGEKDVTTDALVAKDVNGLPYIPGSSIAGIFRSMTEQTEANELFGFQGADNSGQGSKILFTEAKILNSLGNVSDGLLDKQELDDTLLRCYAELPIRQHARLSANGVAEKHAKFDEQVVYAGTRFCFEVEMLDEKDRYDDFCRVVSKINDTTFRIGGGTRGGFGKIKIVSLKARRLNLAEHNDLSEYLRKTSNLSNNYWNEIECIDANATATADWIKYDLHITPVDFFNIGSGYGDDDVDMTPVKASIVDWSNGTGKLTTNNVLIPATSIKGALAHRTAYHWNRIKKAYSSDNNTLVGNDNPAVRLLFGFQDQKTKKQKRGCVIFNDIIEEPSQDKIIAHVKIDRFTGGALPGALFSEKAVYGNRKTYMTEISVASRDIACLTDDESNDYNDAISAFEFALKDLCQGRLPLGGGSSRGNGIFNGKLFKGGKEL